MDASSELAAAVTADLDLGRTAFSGAVRSGDAMGAALAYANDATLVAPDGELVHGRSAIERFWRTGVEIGIDDVELTVLDLRMQGEIALEIGQYALHLTRGSGSRSISRGRYLAVLRLDSDGRWSRTAEMFSPNSGSNHDGQ